jgi:predicted ATP-grasp superfamily ATP-dependent carboligase
MEEVVSVLIPDAASSFALFTLHCLADRPNVRVHVLGQEAWPALRFSRYASSFSYRPGRFDDPAYLDCVTDIIRQKKIDVFLPTDSDAIAFVNSNRNALKGVVAIPPLPGPEQFDIANNKWLTAQFLRTQGLPGPNTLLVSADPGFWQALQEMKFPVMLKPVTSRDGDGIERFDRLADLERHLGSLEMASIAGRFLVQELIDGPVIGLNVLARAGELLAFTIQQAVIPNSKRYSAAGAIKFIQNERFELALRELVARLNFDGYANVDTLCDQDQQLNIIDINARFWGSLRGSMVAGVNFPYLACLAALDIPFPLSAYHPVRYFHPKTGIKHILHTLLGKAELKDVAIKEVGLNYLLLDPIAEVMRAYRQ